MWPVLIAAILLLCVAAYFMMKWAAPSPGAPVATPAAPAPFVAKHLYSETADPNADIGAALAQAKSEHKRVLLDFGGDWCGDCQVLDIYLHDPANRPIVEANFFVVHINVGHYDANLDLAKRYQIPLDKGVPAVAILSDRGTLLYSQKDGEFEAMRKMESSKVTEFLVRWKPVRQGCSVLVVNC
jgi:thiol:disulfide interchange protein